MTKYRAPLVLLLGTFAMYGCWQKLDENAAIDTTSINVDPKGGIGAKFPVNTDTPEIGENPADNGDPTSTTTDPCKKTADDGQAILSNYCDGCHQAGAIGNLVGIDTAAASLIDKGASSAYPGWKYLVAGDPDKSLIFHRVAVVQDMPPPSTVDAPIMHPTISDMSVLQQWIMCMGAAPAADAGTAASADGGAK